MFLWAASLFLAVTSLQKCDQDDEEMIDYRQAQMPYETFARYSQLNDEYGVIAANYWQYMYVERNSAEAENYRSRFRDKGMERAIQNFFAIPIDPKRDKKILDEYYRLKKNLPNLERRSNQSERWRDFFAYIGGAAIVGFCAFQLEKNCKKQT